MLQINLLTYKGRYMSINYRISKFIFADCANIFADAVIFKRVI